MSNPASSKVHTYIGHERSLCGLSPYRGNYNIVSQSEFFSSPVADQCERCTYLMQRRGYSISKLRELAITRKLHEQTSRLTLQLSGGVIHA